MYAVALNDFVSQISMGLDAVEAELVGAQPFHGKRVALICLAVGKHLGYSQERLFSLAVCAMLHDNALTQYILSERPSPEQALNLKSHCEIGEENCSCIPFPISVDGFVKYHHECADGSGVFGLREGEYPEEAGIIALGDRLDVQLGLRHGGSGKLEAVRLFLKEKRGRDYGANVVDAASEVLDEELLLRLQDSQVHDALHRLLPQMESNLAQEQMLALSGLTARIVDYKSKFTKEHTVQIANKAWYLGGVLKYEEKERIELYQAAAFHDLGKLFVPTEILEKPNQLTAEEFTIIKSHAQYTWNLLHSIRGFEKIALWASNHHEKLDGSGYPFGKKGEELDFNSRLLACLDIYQAVREERPYHPSRSHEEAMRILCSMVSNGLIDGDICRLVDEHMALLPGGRAPEPEFALSGSVQST